jgi:hypothetical protein
MTNPTAGATFLGLGHDRAVIEGAASREAARVGHPEVGFEHLLLGVLVNGGPAARLLMDAGVRLAEARAAIDALLREDLALLGIDAALPAPSGSTGAEVLAPLPLAPRLRELVDECPWSGGDTALVAALIDDGGGRVRRLLERVEVDVDRVRDDLGGPLPERGDAAPDTAPAGDDVADPSPEGWEYTAYDLEVPVPVGQVWDVVADPARRGEWDPADVRTRLLDGGVVELTPSDRTPIREAVTHAVEGSEVTWTRAEGQHTTPRTLRIAIEPVGDHARLRLRMGWPNALRGRLANRVVRWIVTQTLRSHAQAIAQAAAS